MGKSVVGGGEGGAAVTADKHTRTIGSDQNVIGIARVNQNIVNDIVRRTDTRPGGPGIPGAPETFGGSGVNGRVIDGILLKDARASGREWNALNLLELLSGAVALINARAGAGIHNAGSVIINDDGEDIAVIDDALLDVAPGLATIAGLPREMPSSGVDNLWIRGIDGDGFEIL